MRTGLFSLGRVRCGKIVPLAFFLIFALVFASAAPMETAHAKKDKPSQGQDYGGYSGPGGDAQYQGGYTGPGPSLVTVKEALSMDDDARVALKGTITRSLGGKEYMFADSTGTSEVKIGHKAWMGQQIGASDTVEIHGKVKKDWTRTRIDVKRIIKQ